jgi:4-hydroxybenzoate polyprenyltransferase
MGERAANFTRYLRTMLVLGRVSNLPTVWSNCVAGWILGGTGPLAGLAWVCAAATLLYVAGMYFNDAFDATFDRLHRPERPIPSGAITVGAVWRWGFAWLCGGLACAWHLGTTPAILATLLSATIIIYDVLHKIFAFSPVLMAACRFFLFLFAASVASDGVTGLAVWSALVLAAYVIGLSFIAQRESTRMAVRYWPVIFLVLPMLLALLVNAGTYKRAGLLLMLVLTIWMLRSLRFAFWSGQRNIGRAVAGLLAGIVLVDALAVLPGAPWAAMIFASLFVLALVFQQFVPAT